MRTRAALVAAAASAAAFLPAQSASAVCFEAYTAVTGHCNPCTHVDHVSRYLHDKFGTPENVTACLT